MKTQVKSILPACLFVILLTGCGRENSQVKVDTGPKTGRVVGIGGIFYKSKDPEATKAWYASNLGFTLNESGALFEFATTTGPEYLQWSPFPDSTSYFLPSTNPYMINYRVENLDELVVQLRNNGVIILDSIESYSYGKFVHILDHDNNKIELWEPIDSVFTRMYKDKTIR